MTVRGIRIRPGQAAEAWLQSTVAELKGGDALRPVTVLTPSHYASLALRRRLAAGGFANVRHEVIGRVAESLGAPALARQRRVPLTPVTEEAAVRAGLRAAGGLGAQSDHRAVVETLRQLFRDLSMERIGAEDRERLASAGELTRVAIRSYDAYRDLLARERLYDTADLLRAATETVAAGAAPRTLADWGGFCLYLPNRLRAAELELLAALAEGPGLVAALPDLEDEVAGQAPRRWAAALGLGWDELPAPGPAAGTAQPRVLVAPDAGEEVRAAVRLLLSDLEQGVPLHRMAIVYRNAEPYQQLVRETLAAAHLPAAALSGRPVAESFAGRGLLGLLHLQGDGFARASVVNWLSALPHASAGPSLAQWDRISREAGIVRGVKQWRDRLGLLVDKRDRKLKELEAEADDSTLALRAHLRSEKDAAEQMSWRIERMNRQTVPPADRDWQRLVEWAQSLRRDLLPDNKEWDQGQREAAQHVDETLQSLAAAAQLDREVTVERFVETLEDALRARRRPEGRLGTGVVYGPIGLAAAMEFDRLYLLGMTERAYPTPSPVDPIVPWEAGEDPLGRAERRQAEERLDYLSALSASGRTVLCFPTHDTEQRPAYPARWLLEAAARLAGRRVGPSELREPRGDLAAAPWLTVYVSAESALTRAPSVLNTAERRTREARDLVQEGGDLNRSALARRADLPVGRGLEAARQRASARFTVYDGNLAEVAPGLKKLAGGLSRLDAISASGVETWAGCPFSYFLGRVLEVEPTERPEDQESWTISPIDRGSLIHSILEEFFRTLHAEGRPAPAEPYSQADRERLQAIAQRHFQEVEDLGQTGYALAWQNTQSAILLDLETVLGRDQDFRAENAVRPEFFEQGFGFEAGWPAAEVKLSDGTMVRLRGYIDRVDLGDGAAYVTDYKTGAAYDRNQFAEDPVVAGTKVQLAVYSNAVRRQLEQSGRPVKRVTASYWFISEKGRFQRVDVEDGEESSRRLAQVMEVVNEGLTRGAFPQVPGEETYFPGRPPFTNCRFCDYHRVCPMGRDQIHDHKREAPGADLPARLARS